MLKKINLIALLIVISVFLTFSSTAWAQEEEPLDEQATFGSVVPDVLFLLDTTTSMDQNPLNDWNRKYGATTSCTADTTNCNVIGKDCLNGFCAVSSTNCATNCSRLGIAKRALFKVLDYNNDNVINNTDSDSMDVRVGALTFNTVGGVSTVAAVGTNYQKVMCGSTKTSQTCNPAKVAAATCYTNPCLVGQTVNSGTNIVQALAAAKTYFNNFTDSSKDCRRKFVILITDGAENKSCNAIGNYDDCLDRKTYDNRKQVVLGAKALAEGSASTATDAPKYKLYVIGFATGMPNYLKNTLNWAAFWGDPGNAEQNTATSTLAVKPMDLGNIGNCPAAGSLYTSENYCQTHPSYDTSDGTSEGIKSVTEFYASSSDPGNATLSGFAFIADSSDSFITALRTTLNAISAQTYSFTQASVQAVRDEQESYMYEASFNYISSDPFWIGHLKRYGIENDTGAIKAFSATDGDWDAGAVLKAATGSGRPIYTLIGGVQRPFTSSYVTAAHLVAGDDATRDKIINFIRNGDTAYPDGTTYDNWKLGDIFHASPLSIGTPNFLFYDRWDLSDPKAFNVYRDEHMRSSDDGTRIIFLGANDGQMHLIKAGDVGDGGGSEVWSFIPPNLLSDLRYIAHEVHPPQTLISGLTVGHRYFVDGSVSAAEIWLKGGWAGTTATAIGSTSKDKDEWKTIGIISLGRGGSQSLWSHSTSCDSDFNPLYTAYYNNYCGYYAFDVSDTTNISTKTSLPEFKWRIGGSAGLGLQDGIHLGQPWSKMFIGRVRISNEERWVGFIGGGYSGSACPNAAAKECSASEAPGKGFYVINMADGSVLWRATHNDATGLLVAHADMDNDLAAGAAAIDSDNDGFLDAAYVPDAGGNVWRFKFCKNSDGDTCSTANWSASKLFENSSGVITPIFTAVSAAMDTSGHVWIYFGTGDKTEPVASNAQENFVAILEDFTTTFEYSMLDNIGSGTGDGIYDASGKHGWYINFTGGGEKILGDPVVFEGVVYFTSYTPASNDPCEKNGTATIYGVNYTTGAGVFDGEKGQEIGSGIATGVTISRGDNVTNVYVSTSAGDGSGGTEEPHTQDVPNIPGGNTANSSLIYWHDMRVNH